jgi:2,3-bisphosphoglycerate-independent phosphoglycerate mutase
MILCVWSQHDFSVLHYKYPYSTGEDGNFVAKVERIERFDAEIPRISR